MSLVEKICEELGVEVGEKWLGNDGNYYKITEDGTVELLDENGELVLSGHEYWEDIFTEKLKPEWKPKVGETYYVPDIYGVYESMYTAYNWNNSLDNIFYNRGLVFKTKEEAVSVANKILEAIREGLI